MVCWSRDDAVCEELQKPDAQKMPFPVDDDLFRMGHYYCLHCDEYFADVTLRDEHFRTIQHKKRKVTDNVCMAKQHCGGRQNQRVFKNCQEYVGEENDEHTSQNFQEGEQVHLLSDFNETADQVEEEKEYSADIGCCNKRISSSGESFCQSSKSFQSKSKMKRQKAAMDAFFTPDPEIIVGKAKQTTNQDAYKKELRDRACKQIARWMYDAGVPLNAVNFDSFKIMIEAIGQCGQGMKPPTYYEVKVPLLKSELQSMHYLLKRHKGDWAKRGCSIMVEGWQDKRKRTFINFLVNSSEGTMFIDSVDASSYARGGERMFILLDEFVEHIGAANVVQVVTDNTPSNILAGRLLEAKHPCLYWSPCAAHCLDLMLEDIAKLPDIKKTLRRAVMLNGYIYNRQGVLNLMRYFTGKKSCLGLQRLDLLTAFITLSNIYRQKDNLIKMFTSEDWTTYKWSGEKQGKRVTEIVLMPSFWENVAYSINVSIPIVHILRLVYSEKKPFMGYIYKAINKAKETIANNLRGNEEKFKKIFEIIDRRWEIQLLRPLHAAGYFLNPKFFSANSSIEKDEVMMGLYKCIEKLVPSTEVQEKIDAELTKYKRAEGIFRLNMVARQRSTLSPVLWWELYGASIPNLQKFAIKVLSLTCRASDCEQNWSLIEQLHSKRNMIAETCLNDLVFVKYNRALRHRYNMRDTIDPISLKDTDDDNEWLIGTMDEDSNADDGLLSDDDSFTCGAKARDAGVGEGSHHFRSRITSKAATMALISPYSSLPIIDEEETNSAETEEEDPEGYESYNWEDDDVVFDDL